MGEEAPSPVASPDGAGRLVAEGPPPMYRNPSRLKVLKDMVVNLPTELKQFGRIPCAQRSLYSGILLGGIVSALSLVLTGIDTCVHTCTSFLTSS